MLKRKLWKKRKRAWEQFNDWENHIVTIPESHYMTRIRLIGQSVAFYLKLHRGHSRKTTLLRGIRRLHRALKILSKPA